jgi:hypothetical protein
MRSVWTKRTSKMVLMIPLVLIGLTVFSLLVMWLWNWLVPPVFGWHSINFSQAVGIFVLSKILFGGPRGWGRGMHARGRMRLPERWEQMTPEEREKFRKGLQGRLCGASRAQSEPDMVQGGSAQV